MGVALAVLALHGFDGLQHGVHGHASGYIIVLEEKGHGSATSAFGLDAGPRLAVWWPLVYVRRKFLPILPIRRVSGQGFPAKGFQPEAGR